MLIDLRQDELHTRNFGLRESNSINYSHVRAFVQRKINDLRNDKAHIYYAYNISMEFGCRVSNYSMRTYRTDLGHHVFGAALLKNRSLCVPLLYIQHKAKIGM